MRKILLAGILISCLAASMASCGNKPEATVTEKTEATVAEIEAAQMAGRNEARRFVNREWKDSMELQNQVLEARSKRSEYEIAKKKECADAYDKGFMETIKAVRPDLYKALGTEKQK